VTGPLIEEAVALEGASPAGRLTESPAFVQAWLDLLDDELSRAHERFEALRQLAEVRGDESSLAGLLIQMAQADLRAGRWAEAEAHAREAAAVSERNDQEHNRMLGVLQLGAVAVLRGERDLAERHLEEVLRYGERAGDAFLVAAAKGNLGLLVLGSGDAPTALRRFTEAQARLAGEGYLDPALGRFHGDLLEALVALGELERAEDLADQMDAAARPANRRRAVALVAYGRGLVHAARGESEAAVGELTRAVEALTALGMPFEAARSALALGIVHRRGLEKRLAHERLSEALRAFEALGAAAWAARARAELGRVGLRPRAPAGLTETERLVARLAAEGRTSREIAELAFLSPRSVEKVLSRVYGKLAIRSRAELGRALDRLEEQGQPG
jgi:DNA-binding CsgD family transcriptional regulator